MARPGPLDFGHWSAHKLEQLSDYRWRHGEAVAVGICLDVTYAQLSGLIPVETRERIVGLFRALGLPTYAPELNEHLGDPDSPRNVLRGLNEFREHLGGQLTIMLLHGIGQGFEVNEIDQATMIRSIAVLRDEAEAAQSPTEGTHDHHHAGNGRVPALATATD